MAPRPPDRFDVDRIVGRNPVEIAAVGVAPFGEAFRHAEEVRRIADRHRHDPFARPGFAHQRRDPVENVLDRAAACERRIDQALEPLPVHVGMPVDQAGHHGAPRRIQNARPLARQRDDLVVAADRGEAAVLHGQGGRDAEPRIDRDHLAAAEDQVRGDGAGGRHRPAASRSTSSCMRPASALLRCAASRISL